MTDSPKKILLRDSTLREGFDTPNVHLSLEEKLAVARLLDETGVAEAEVAAPSRILKDLEFVKELKKLHLRLKTSGLVYAHRPQAREEMAEAGKHLDRIDLLMPVSFKRKPFEKETKIKLLADALEFAAALPLPFGAGFPHAAQTDTDFLAEIVETAVRKGAQRIILYDTNGQGDPFSIFAMVRQIKPCVPVPLIFHGHNDLGLATANSLAAVLAGADGLDVTVNGLGDRAGNASLEQAALTLHLKGFETGIIFPRLKALSEYVEKASGVAKSKLAPVVGEYVFLHKSPSHLEIPDLFEAFDPGLVGRRRELIKSER